MPFAEAEDLPSVSNHIWLLSKIIVGEGYKSSPTTMSGNNGIMLWEFRSP